MDHRFVAIAIATLVAACSAGTVSRTNPTTATVPSSTDLSPVTTAPREPVQVLVFHKTAGYRHGSIPAGIEAIASLSAEYGFTVTATEDASVFTESSLAAYDVIVFLSTTGDILDEHQERAMEHFIEAGHGFVGVHAAADTEYDWPWYGKLVGAYFDSHPDPQPATVDVVAAHPTTQDLARTLTMSDEWYNFQALPGSDVTILATLDETSYNGGSMGELHPIAWAHEYDGGRAFYTAFGHSDESYSEPLVLTLLANAILWVSEP
jgi:type 1 glutamine amidotransferase